MTTYTKRTNAKRAASKAGIPELEVELTVHKVAGEAPRFGFKRKETQVQAPAWAAGKAQRATAATVLATPRERRNGVSRPRAGGLCAAVWDWLDQCRSKEILVTGNDVKAQAEIRRWNANNASIEYYQWRKFNALSRPGNGRRSEA